MPNPKVLVTGANGQLGSALRRYLRLINVDGDFVTRTELDLEDLMNMESFFVGRRYDFIVNCAAYTAVDRAEKEEMRAYTINASAVEALARISRLYETILIHISTDYVFDGEDCTPYTETDDVNPLSVYGKSKLLGEQAIQAIKPLGIIIRTSWLYSLQGGNFLTTMLRLGEGENAIEVVCDQIGTPTFVDDLAHTICQLILDKTLVETCGEVYHFSNEGVASWYDFARVIFDLSKISCEVIPIESSQYTTLAQRPHYSVLNKKRIKRDFGVKIRHWQDALKTALQVRSATMKG